MKKTVFLLCVLFLFCSCTDAEFYDDSSVGLASEDNISDTETPEKPQYMYAVMWIDFQLETTRGALETICRVNPETGEAFPLCFDPTCDHGAPWCTATYVKYFAVNSNGKKVYYWKENSGHGYLQQPGTGKSEQILYEFDTATLKIKEIDRCESTNYNWNLLAFDDGLVYNKYVVTEKDAFGETVSYSNIYYKVQTDGSVVALDVPQELNIYFREGQLAYNATVTGNAVYDSELNLQKEIEGVGAEGFFALNNALNRPISVVSDRSDPDQTIFYSYARNKNGEYEKHLLPENTDSTTVLQDYILLLENGGEDYGTVTVDGKEYSRAAFTVHCMDPYTGEKLYSVDLTDRFASFGLNNVTSFSFAPGRREQIRIGNYQACIVRGEDTLCGLPTVMFLFNAETGEILRVNY